MPPEVGVGVLLLESGSVLVLAPKAKEHTVPTQTNKKGAREWASKRGRYPFCLRSFEPTPTTPNRTVLLLVRSPLKEHEVNEHEGVDERGAVDSVRARRKLDYVVVRLRVGLGRNRTGETGHFTENGG